MNAKLDSLVLTAVDIATKELEMRLTDQMGKDGKRIRELETSRDNWKKCAEANGRSVKRLSAEVEALETKLVQAGEGFPS